MAEKREKNKSKGDRRLLLPISKLTDPAVIVDKDGKLLEVAKQVEEITGLKRKDLVGENFLDLDILTEESKRTLKENLARRMAGERVELYEIELLTKDGAKRSYGVTGLLVEYKGEPADLATFRDITEYKKIENRIKMEREAYQSIARAANQSRSVGELCEQALRGIQRAVKYDMADILAYRESENALFPAAQVGYPKDLHERTIERQDLKGQGVAARAVCERKSVCIEDMKTSKLVRYAHDLIMKYDISTLCVVPLFSRGKLQGVLEVLTVGDKKLSKEDREVLGTISEELAGGIAKAKIEETLLTAKEAFGWIPVLSILS